MQVRYKVNNDVNIHADVEGVPEAFDALAQLHDVFSTKCGKCNNPNVIPKVRMSSKGKKEFKYREFVCPKCRAKVNVSITEGGDLFLRWYKVEDGDPVLDDNGKKVPLGAGGWTVWDPNTKVAS